MGKDFQKKLKSWWPFLILIVASVLLYSYRLDRVPVHLNQDELEFSLNAYSISKTLTDESGRFLPFYFWHLNAFWATPVVVYLASMFLRLLPLAEATIRLPSVLVGVSTIGFLMILSQKIFKNKFLTLATGFFAVTTPVLFIHSRLLLDNLYPVPFVVLWLIFLVSYLKNGSPFLLFSSGLALGVGIHSYHAAKIMMPIYFLVTLIIFWQELRKDFKSLSLFFLGFLIPIILFLPWLNAYPDTLLNQVSYIGSIDSSVDAQKGLWGVFSLGRTGEFLSNYVTYLTPGIPFFTGDRSLIHSTATVGAFLFPVVFLLIFGILKTFLSKDKFAKLILFGFLAYPIAPAIVNDPQRISRGLVVIPFLLLLSIYGLKYLMAIRKRVFKILIILVFGLSFIQFAFFLRDYFGIYRQKSYGWFNNDIGGALESATRSTRIRNVKNVYIDKNIYFIERYVKFYSLKLSSDLESRAIYFDPAAIDFSSFPIYSLVVLKAENASGRAGKVGGFEKIETIREPNGYETFYIFYRDE